MPLKRFICPDGEEISIEACLEPNGCRMGKRCATQNYLRLVGYDREWRLSPSCAGNGARYEYLRATTDYAVDPIKRAFAALGTGVHGILALHDYNVLAEESLSDDLIHGTGDELEPDEELENSYVLTDHKTWGSYKVMLALGIQVTDVPETDDKGNAILYKSGQKKGQVRTKKQVVKNPDGPELLDVAYQLNRYRILFEAYGFPISRMQVQAIVRDGNTYIAKSRGIDREIYLIPVPHMPDYDVLGYYKGLSEAITSAFDTGYAPMCGDWETWARSGQKAYERPRCANYCDVKDACIKMTNGRAA